MQGQENEHRNEEGNTIHWNVEERVSLSAWLFHRRVGRYRWILAWAGVEATGSHTGPSVRPSRGRLVALSVGCASSWAAGSGWAAARLA